MAYASCDAHCTSVSSNATPPRRGKRLAAHNGVWYNRPKRKEGRMATRAIGGLQRARHKILIVDDHPIVRQGLARLMGQEPDFEVFEGPDNVAEALEQIKTLRPELVLVDISLKDSSGLNLISQIKTHDSRIKTLVWSMFDEKVYAERAAPCRRVGLRQQTRADPHRDSRHPSRPP